MKKVEEVEVRVKVIMAGNPNSFASKAGKAHTFMPLEEYKLGSITADKPPKEYEIKNAKAQEGGQQSMKYFRQYLTFNDPRYPGLTSPVFVSKGKLTIMKFVSTDGKENWSCFFSLTKEEQKATTDIMSDLYKILIQYKDFYGVVPDDLEEGEDPNKAMLRIAKKNLASIAKYPKDKNDPSKKKEDKSKQPFLSSKIRDDITECFFLVPSADGKKKMQQFDYKLLEKRTFEAARYVHIRDIYTSKLPSVQVFMKKITMLEPPATTLNIDDEYDDYAQSMYGEVNDETVNKMAEYFQGLMAKGSSSSSSKGGEEDGESSPSPSPSSNSQSHSQSQQTKASNFSAQLGGSKSGISGLQFEKSAPQPQPQSQTDEGGNNFSSPVLTQRDRSPIFATTNPLGMNNTSRQAVEEYVDSY